MFIGIYTLSLFSETYSIKNDKLKNYNSITFLVFGVYKKTKILD